MPIPVGPFSAAMRISVSSCFFEQAANAASEKSITAAVIIATIRFIKFFFMSFFITFSPFHSFQRYYQSKIYSHSLRIFSVSLCNSALNNAWIVRLRVKQAFGLY